MTEQTQVSLGGPGRAGHPGLEELAALADGRCRSTDAARVRSHLASCEDCYEVFLETVQLLEELEEEDKEDPPVPGEEQTATSGKPSGEEEAGAVPQVETPWRSASPWWRLPGRKGEQPGKVLAFPFNEDMKPHYRWAAAALVVVVLGVGFYKVLPNLSPPSVAGLAASAGTVDRVGDLAWGERTRGVGSHEGEPSFRLGVELLNLQVALKSKDPNAADAAAAATNGLLEPIFFMDSKFKDFYIQLRPRLFKQPPGRLPLETAKETAKQADDLHNSESIDKLYFELGSWAEAGRFAAYSKNPAYFAKTDSGDFLSRLQKDGEVPPEVKSALETIDTKLAAPGHKDYAALGRAFDQILKAYYAEGERGGL